MLGTCCPTCGREVTAGKPGTKSDFPFCSPRCRMADLDRWFTEDYRVPGEQPASGLEADAEGRP